MTSTPKPSKSLTCRVATHNSLAAAVPAMSASAKRNTRPDWRARARRTAACSTSARPTGRIRPTYWVTISRQRRTQAVSRAALRQKLESEAHLMQDDRRQPLACVIHQKGDNSRFGCGFHHLRDDVWYRRRHPLDSSASAAKGVSRSLSHPVGELELYPARHVLDQPSGPRVCAPAPGPATSSRSPRRGLPGADALRPSSSAIPQESQTVEPWPRPRSTRGGVRRQPLLTPLRRRWTSLV